MDNHIFNYRQLTSLAQNLLSFWLSLLCTTLDTLGRRAAMRNRFHYALFFLCWLIPVTALALGRPESVPMPSPALIYSPKNTDILVFQGTIEKTGDGTGLRTEAALFPLLGGDFAMIVGERVKIIGKVVQEDREAKILVARVQFPRHPLPAHP